MVGNEEEGSLYRSTAIYKWQYTSILQVYNASIMQVEKLCLYKYILGDVGRGHDKHQNILTELLGARLLW